MAKRVFAMWSHVLGRIERQQHFDYIFIDLNPAPSRFNYLAMLW